MQIIYKHDNHEGKLCEIGCIVMLILFFIFPVLKFLFLVIENVYVFIKERQAIYIARKMLNKYPNISKVKLLENSKTSKNAELRLKSGKELRKIVEGNNSKYWDELEAKLQKESELKKEFDEIVGRYSNGYNTWLSLHANDEDYMEKAVASKYKIRKYNNAYYECLFFNKLLSNQVTFNCLSDVCASDGNSPHVSKIQLSVNTQNRYGENINTQFTINHYYSYGFCEQNEYDCSHLPLFQKVLRNLQNIRMQERGMTKKMQIGTAELINDMIGGEGESLVLMSGHQLLDGDKQVSYETLINSINCPIRETEHYLSDNESMLELKGLFIIDFESTTDEMLNKCNVFLTRFIDEVHYKCKNTNKLLDYSLRIMCFSVLKQFSRLEMIKMFEVKENEDN